MYRHNNLPVSARPEYDTVLFSPHLDDAVFSMGAALLAGLFGKTRIVNVFTRSCYTVAALGDECEVTLMRRQEDAKAMQLLGADAVCWEYPDSSIKPQYADEAHYMSPANNPADDACFSVVQDRINKEFAQFPGALFFSPLGLGSHIDHTIVAAICSQLSSSGAACLYYEDGSYFTNLPDQASRLAFALGLERSITIDPGNLDGKLQLASVYTSQWNKEIRENLRQSYLHCGGERLWCTNATAKKLFDLLEQNGNPAKGCIIF